MGINGQIIWTVYIKGNINGSKTYEKIFTLIMRKAE